MRLARLAELVADALDAHRDIASGHIGKTVSAGNWADLRHSVDLSYFAAEGRKASV